MSQECIKRQIVGRDLPYELNDGEYVRGRKRGIRAKFTVSPQICLAINDIDYVLQFIDPFVKGVYNKIKSFVCIIGNSIPELSTEL